MSMSELNQNVLPTYAVVDSDFLVYKIAFSTEDVSETIAKGRLTEWLEDFLFITLKVDEYECHLTGKTNFRNDIAVTAPYKGNRVDLKKPKHYQALRDHLVKRHGAVISVNEEADDTVAIAATQKLDKCWIVGQDKDLDQLQGWHYNPVRDERYYVDEFTAYKSFATQLLTGDRIDNIPCLAGIGPKKAAKALQDAKTKEDLLRCAWKKYEELGHTMEYFTEQGQLLWLRRYEGQIWQPPNKLQLSTDSGQDSKSE